VRFACGRGKGRCGCISGAFLGDRHWEDRPTEKVDRKELWTVLYASHIDCWEIQQTHFAHTPSATTWKTALICRSSPRFDSEVS
jgi:hypothetical protein